MGKGKGIPQSLCAFARVLCCNVPQEEVHDLSNEAEQNDGRLARVPFKDRSRELEVHKILLSHINRFIVLESRKWKNLNATLYHKDLLLEGRWQVISYPFSFVF